MVALGEEASERARIERARATSAEVVVVAPWARWTQDQHAPAPSYKLVVSALARRTLVEVHAEAPLDEIHCRAEDGGGWGIGLGSRQHGECPGAAIVIEAGAETVRPVQPGWDVRECLFAEAVQQSVRDADRVEGAVAPLLEAGWQVATKRAQPAWAPGTNPTISAIVTHKDLQRYLPACLASLRAQTVPVEIVLVDDGSGPEGLAVVDEEERKDSALRVIRQSNQGLPEARNVALRAATGELAMIVDADNTLRPRCIERLVEALRNRPSVVAAVPAFEAFEVGTNRPLFQICPAELSPRTLLVENTGGDACALHRRQELLALGGYQRSLESAAVEDWDLWLGYLEAGLQTCVVPEVLFDYRVRPESMLRRNPLHWHESLALNLANRHRGILARHVDEVILLTASRMAIYRGLAERAQEERPKLDAEIAKLDYWLNREREDSRKARAERDQARQAALDEAARARALLARADEEVAAAQARAAAAERLADEEGQRMRVAEELAAGLSRALEEITSSTAVRLARALRGLSPGAHRAVGATAKLLRLKGR